jgi:allophanate hydrolase
MPGLDLLRLRAAYDSRASTPSAIAAEVLRRIAAAGEDGVWISRRPDGALLAEARALDARWAERGRLPLYGVPFAVKDNIDVAGLPTTAACPAYARDPAETAPVVARLVAAGALLVGKTNLDQFATGLVGTRSPYGTPRNPFDPAMPPGGSSSGSAVAVAAGLVGFALGTDTAGSGRVPASFNNLVGLKPTRGLLSTRGVVPACRSLDCVSILALTVDDALAVLDVARGFDAQDPCSRAAPPGFSCRVPPPARFAFGVPRRDQRRFHGDREAPGLFDAAIARAESLGGAAREIDFAPWTEVADLLYGPWVAERTAALPDGLRDTPGALHPVTRAILAAGEDVTAVQLFAAMDRLRAARQAIRPVWRDIEFLLVPTTGTAPTLARIEADPVARNAELGTYTNFANLLDLAAIAVPSGLTAAGFPAGVTLVGPAWHDAALAGFARRLHRASGLPLGATGRAQPESGLSQPGLSQPGPSAPQPTWPAADIAVFGAHLSGEPLNPDLLALGATLRGPCRTAPLYRMVALPGRVERPGLLRGDGAGSALDGEIWSVPSQAVASLLGSIAPPLGLGTVLLEGGATSLGFICEAGPARDAPDISRFGGWRAYRAAGGG